MSEAFFAIRYTPATAAFFRLLGLGPAQSGVWVGRDSIRVTMGWGFRSVRLRTLRISLDAPDQLTSMLGDQR